MKTSVEALVFPENTAAKTGVERACFLPAVIIALAVTIDTVLAGVPVTRVFMSVADIDGRRPNYDGGIFKVC